MLFYAVDDEDELTYICPEEAALAWCDNLLEEDELPEFVKVRVFKPDEIGQDKLPEFLQNIYEYLDEEYGDPYSDWKIPDRPDSVHRKYQELIEEIIKTYNVRKCVPTGDVVMVPTKGLFLE